MLEQLFDMGGVVINHVGELSYKEWLIVFALGVLVGAFCLRGYGSRKSY